MGALTASAERERWRDAVFLAGFLLIGCVVWWCPADNVQIVLPDSVEYVTAAEYWLQGEGLRVRLGGVLHPTRYPPGFPVLFVAPFYAVGSQSPGSAIYGVLASGIGALLCCWILCRRILPGARGIAAAFVTQLVVFQLAQVQHLVQLIMSDVPITFACLVSLLAFWKGVETGWLRWWLLGGVAVSAAVSMRITNLALCTPFLLTLVLPARILERVVAASSPSSRWERGLVFLVPVVVTVGVLLFYQYRTFGSPFYTGYQYWLAEHAYALHWRHLTKSLPEMLHPFTLPHRRQTALDWLVGPLALALSLAAGLACRWLHPTVWARSRPAVFFLATFGAPTIAFFAFYPFADARFVMVLHIVWLCLGVLWAASLAPAERGTAALGVACLAAALSLAGAPGEREKPYVNVLLERMDRELPDDAVVVGTLRAMAVERFVVGDTDREYVPLAVRGSQEGWKVGAYGEPRRDLGITSATTDPGQLLDVLASGRPVYVITQQSRWAGFARELDALLGRFETWVVLELRNRDAVVRLERVVSRLAPGEDRG